MIKLIKEFLVGFCVFVLPLVVLKKIADIYPVEIGLFILIFFMTLFCVLFGQLILCIWGDRL